MSPDPNEMALENITVDDLVGKKIENLNLIVAPPPKARMACGDLSSFQNIINRTSRVNGIIWNERNMVLLTDDRSMTIRYVPEISDAAQLFCHPPDRSRSDREGNPYLIWDGVAMKVQLTKRQLMAFLKAYKSNIDPDVLATIKAMKLVEKKTHDEDMLALDSDDVRVVEEETSSTNIPKEFAIDIPVAENYIGHFKFDASICTLKDKYDRDTNKKGLELRCLNAREVLQDMMKQLLAKLPPGIPRYYGMMEVEWKKE